MNNTSFGWQRIVNTQEEPLRKPNDLGKIVQDYGLLKEKILIIETNEEGEHTLSSMKNERKGEEFLGDKKEASDSEKLMQTDLTTKLWVRAVGISEHI